MTNEKLTYDDLNLPTFVNSREAILLTAHDEMGKEEQIVVPLYDIPKAVVVMGGALLNIGDTRCGKTKLMRDVHRHYFGGDADNGGRSNWNVARNDFSADAYFTTIDQAKIGEGKGLVADAKIPVERRIKALCNIVDEINLAIPEVQVEFFGMAEGRHKGLDLGENGYHLFMSSCNLNRVNGDFTGTSQINRALLNRFGVTLDFDFFRRTDGDDDVLSQKSGLEQAPIRDISDKIMHAYQEITAASGQIEPWLDAYVRIFSSGLEYCEKDSDNRKKRIWPSKCGSCDFTKKDLCSIVKQSSTGTSMLLKRFAHAINYIIGLKHGQKSLDPLDLALGAFQFTTYHGNLNGIETMSKYSGEDQEQMKDAIKKIRGKIEPVRDYINFAVDSAVNGNPETRFIKIIVPGKKPKILIYSGELKEKLDTIYTGPTKPYEIIEPFSAQFGKNNGIRLDWIPGYLKNIAAHYKK